MIVFWIFIAHILYSPLTQTAFDSSAVPVVENQLTVNQLARKLLPLKVTNKEIDAGLKRVSEKMYILIHKTLLIGRY